MKRTFLLAAVALMLGASVKAQSTVDSIAAKYKLLPMPDSLTIEKTFPALGTYQLGNELNNATATVSADSAAGTSGITITMDSSNKGIVWVEGLPEGRFKAYLRQSPATYRIISQKTESGKQIPEGTLIYDSTTHTLNIALGKAYNETDPAAIFAMNPNNGTEAAVTNEPVKVKTKTSTSKSKAKVTFYTATKNEPVVNTMDQNMMNNQMNNQTDSNGTQTPDSSNQTQDQNQNPTNNQNPANNGGVTPQQ